MQSWLYFYSPASLRLLTHHRDTEAQRYQHDLEVTHDNETRLCAFFVIFVPLWWVSFYLLAAKRTGDHHKVTKDTKHSQRYFLISRTRLRKGFSYHTENAQRLRSSGSDSDSNKVVSVPLCFCGECRNSKTIKIQRISPRFWG